MEILFAVYYMPAGVAVAFLLFFALVRMENRRREFLRALTALLVATALAHVNRVFLLWPADPWFPSGHMTFSLGAAVSMALLRPWTLVLSVPFLAVFGIEIVRCGFHNTFEVVGAIPLVAVVYPLVYRFWPRRQPWEGQAPP